MMMLVRGPFPLSLLGFTFAMSSACTDFASEGASPPDDGGRGIAPMDGGAQDVVGDSAAHDPHANGVDVKGLVLDYIGSPLPKARVLVVDARNVKTEAISDSSGGFAVSHVAIPYDVKVSSSSAELVPEEVLLGITRRDPTILTYHSAGPPTPPPVQNKATISVPISFPGCVNRCEAQIWISSARGLGRQSVFSTGPMTTKVASVEHEWWSDHGAPTTTAVTVDVLVSNEVFSAFWYVRSGTWALQSGGTLELGTITPQSVGTFGPITITTTDTGVPSDWDKSLQAFLQLPSVTSGMYLQRVAASTLVTFVPNIPGATFSVGAWRAAPDVRDAKGMSIVQRNSSASSEELPLSVSAMSLSMVKGPDMVRPTPSGKLSRASAGLSWQSTPGRIARVHLVDSDRKASLGFVTTGGSELRFDRLANFGITFRDGPHRIVLETSSGASVDALVDPTRPAYALGDRERTSYAFGFEVMP